MNLFVWTDSLATGSKFIDQDHHELVRLVNAVLEPIAEQRGSPALTLALGFTAVDVVGLKAAGLQLFA